MSAPSPAASASPGYLDILRAQLAFDEGRRNRIYGDTRGKLTIGIGFNLSDNPLPDFIVDALYDYSEKNAELAARKWIPTFDLLSDVRKAVVVEMSFQLGYSRLSGFAITQAAILRESWNDAADAMLDSEVAKVEAPARWHRLANMMRSDTWTPPPAAPSPPTPS